MTPEKPDELTRLARRLAQVIEQARGQVRQSVNRAIVASYWEVGRLIVEHEQKGHARAANGQRQLAELSARLAALFGRGFDVSSLRNMRRFHLAFPIRETMSLESIWSHYNALVWGAEQRQLFAAKYLPYLPSKEELKRELKRERERALMRLAREQEARR